MDSEMYLYGLGLFCGLSFWRLWFNDAIKSPLTWGFVMTAVFSLLCVFIFGHYIGALCLIGTPVLFVMYLYDKYEDKVIFK